MGFFVLDQSLLAGPNDRLNFVRTGGSARWVQYKVRVDNTGEMRVLGLVIYYKPEGERRDR